MNVMLSFFLQFLVIVVLEISLEVLSFSYLLNLVY